MKYVSCGFRPTKKPKRKNRTKVDHPSQQTPARIFEFFDVFGFFLWPSDLLDTFGKFGAQLGWLLSPKVNHHPERGANQVELEIIQIRDSKSETFLTVRNIATLQRMFFFIHLFGSVLLLAMTHSKCFVTAEQNAAYAALMPQTSSIQVGISDCVFWKPKNMCVFFFSHTDIGSKHQNEPLFAIGFTR